MMRNQLEPIQEPSRLQRLFEQLIDRLRGIRRNDTDVIPVQVDLVGDTGFRRRINATKDSSVNPFLRVVEPSISTLDQSASAAGALTEPWSFREAVLLKPTRRSSRILLYTALGFTGLSFLWLVIAPLNQTIAVQGKLEPNSKVKIIQTLVPGLVDIVLIKEGETVQTGQLLLKFDLRDAKSKLQAAKIVRAKLVDENLIYAVALGDKSSTEGLSINQLNQLRSQAAELLDRREVARQELLRSQARLSGYQKALSTSSNIANRYQQLVRSGAVSEVQSLETQARADEHKAKIEEEEREQSRLQAALRATSSAPNAEFRGRIENNLRQIADFDRQIREASLQLQYGELRAPAGGVVFDLDARRGSVAQAAQPLLKIVPNEALRAKVYLPSSVIGFIQPGQKVDISLDTFPAMDYGRLEAKVQRVGSDALTPEQQKQSLGTDSSGLHFPAVLSLDHQYLKAGKKQIALQPGMGLTADIYLRQRRMINVITGFFEDKLRSLERMR